MLELYLRIHPQKITEFCTHLEYVKKFLELLLDIKSGEITSSARLSAFCLCLKVAEIVSGLESVSAEK